MIRRIVPVLLLVLLPLGAAAQTGDPGQRIATARRQAEAAGIPVALLDSKVAEGRAKGVPADRIATAVEHRLGALSRAREVMGARTTAADLSVGADALEGGVTPEALRVLASTAPATQRAVAIAVLTQLVREGEASERALQRVQAAIARDPASLRSLPGQSGRERGPDGDGPPGQGQGRGVGRGNGQGRGNAGPPPSVPGPRDRPDRGGGKKPGRGGQGS